MIIVHELNDFLYDLFPKANADRNNLDILKEELTKYYTYQVYKPEITIENNIVTIKIDTPAIINQEGDYKKAVSLCEKREFSKAKPILEGLIKKNPTNSEYHRILGQVLSEEGNQEDAINSLIDAIKWDNKNGWALIMMGNIFAKYKDDIITAKKYYDEAVKINPENYIALNNIGDNLKNQGKIDEAKLYLEKALSINPDYPNSIFALALIADKEADHKTAFNYSIEALRKYPPPYTGVFYREALNLAINTATKLIDSDSGKKIFNNYLHKIEFDDNHQIDVIEDNSIKTTAKLELAENYKRDNHIIKFKSGYPAVEHLQMHELVHLDLMIQARKENCNKLFVSNQTNKASFLKSIEPSIRNLKKMGYDEKFILSYGDELFSRFNLQIYNAPLDLFIENFLYNEFPDLRPYQFLSVFSMIMEGLKAVTDKKVKELMPTEIVSKSKIYNMISAMQLKDLYGINLIKDFKANPFELKESERLYNEYLEYKDDKKPGEEYELLQHWAEDLNLDKFFELVDEDKYRERTNLGKVIENIEKDPLGIETADPEKEKKMQSFLKSQEAIGLNMTVVMYMAGALNYFKEIPKDKIKQIALEISLQGSQGYRPDKKDYRINSIPGKLFSGYQILAYYYVSFKLALPEMLSQLELPYDKEYEIAVSFNKK